MMMDVDDGTVGIRTEVKCLGRGLRISRHSRSHAGRVALALMLVGFTLETTRTKPNSWAQSMIDGWTIRRAHTKQTMARWAAHFGR